MPDHYETLGVEPTASEEDIKDAYRQMMKIIHPDRNPNNPQAEAWAKRVNAAYEVLSHPGRRAEYDRSRNDRASDPPHASDWRAYTGNGPRESGPASEFPFSIPLEVVDSGLVTEYRTYGGVKRPFKIPPGVEEGERIPIIEEDGTPITLVIAVERHDSFHRRGADLYTELSIHKADALRRTVVSLAALRGRVDVLLRPAFLEGKTFCARGQGLPHRHDPAQRGDLHVSFVVLPTPDRPVSVTLEEVDSGCSRRLDDLGVVAKIPPGVATGSRVYIGADHGRETNLLVSVRPHPRITRRGDDLHLTAEVSHIALLLRSERRLDVLGRPVTVPLHPKYADGREVCRPDEGLPNLRNPKRRGNLYVTFTVRNEIRPAAVSPGNRRERLAGFARKAARATLHAAGMAHGAIRQTVAAWRNLNAAIDRHRERILTILKIAAIAVAAIGAGFAVYFIIVNIVAILTAIAAVAIVAGLLYVLFRGRF